MIKKIIFLGTGPSSGVPNLHCLSSNKCKNCLTNRRTNVSILIETNEKPILIDCTKDFYTQYYNYLSKSNNSNLFPTVILTHEHADAILGLDYLRQTVPRNFKTEIYSDEKTINYLKNHFSYLFRDSYQNQTVNGAFYPKLLNLNKENKISNLSVLPFHVEHGKNCFCLAFLIENKILYVSDCSNFDTVPIYEIEILIVECTTMDGKAYGHSNFNDCLKLIERIKPKKTFLVGMSHLIDYDELCKKVEDLESKIIVAYDGMEILL
ncbi:hypothetical protein GVAV_000285 [Gurleya vavrai]